MRRRLRGERGTASIEVVALMPVVVLVVLIGFQLMYATGTINATNQAVRDGARAQSLDQSVSAAVDRSLPGSLSAESVTVGGNGRVTVRVKVPRVGFFPEFVITRSAVMP